MRTKTLIRGIAVALACALPALPAMAARYELQGGISYMDTYSTPVAFGEVIFDPNRIGSSNWSWSPDVTAGWIDGRNLQRYADSHPGVTDHAWLLAGGARFHYGAQDAWYRKLFFSFQPAVHTGRTQALSSSYEFVSTLGYQGDHWSLALRHISNGSFEEPNRGETMVVAGVAF